MSDAEDQTILERVIDDPIGTLADLAVPVPPVIKKSLWKAIAELVTAGADIPKAWLEGKAQGIRDVTAARSAVLVSAGVAAAEDLKSDPTLVRRATHHFASRMFREQRNREAVAREAVRELQSLPPGEDATREIDADWLSMFARIAEQRSDADMRALLGKILAGEIRAPGSFSPATVQALTLLTPATANLFRDFCQLSVEWTTVSDLTPCVVAEPYGSPGNNALAVLGFSYPRLTALQDAGLIKSDLASYQDFPREAFLLPMMFGGKALRVRDVGATEQKQLRSKILLFTNTGLEIRRLLLLEPNHAYEAKFGEWLETTYGLKLE